jgi:hypothetical protein
MRTFTNLTDLLTNDLYYKDQVVFNINGEKITGEVCKSHLSLDTYNWRVFTLLKIEDRYEFCSDYYGYASGNGAWPTFKFDDYTALKRVLIALFEIIEGKKTVLKRKYKTINLRV